MGETMEQPGTRPETERNDPALRRRRVLALYIALYGAIALCLIPSFSAAIVSVIILILVVTVIYQTRKDAEARDDDFTYSHARHLIRTFWIANLYLAVFMIVSILYFMMFMRIAALTPCTRTLIENAEFLLQTANVKNLLDIVSPCAAKFVVANKPTLQTSAVLAFGPALLYLLIRFLWGWPRALRYRTAYNTDKQANKVRLRDV